MPATPIAPAERTKNIKYAVRDVLALADEAKARGLDLLHLNIGDPNIYGFSPPAAVAEAAIRAIHDNLNGYAPSDGTTAALSAIREDAEARGTKAIQHIAITSGCSEAIEIALSALVNAGDRVLVPAPGYPLYTAILAKLDAVAVPYHLDESNDWQPDVDEITSLLSTPAKALVLINPNNPTGSVTPREVLEHIVAACKAAGTVLFADEIYDQLVLTGETPPPIGSIDAEVPVVTFNGLSKAYVAPGWRIGWAIVSGPKEIVGDWCEAMAKMERARLSANHPLQHAIPAALQQQHPEIEAMREALRIRGQLISDRLNAIPGISSVPPKGAFYAFPSINLGVDDRTFCAKVIQETGAIIVPGSGFGQKQGTEHFRVVFLPNEDILSRACDGIAAIAAHFQSQGA